MASDNGAPPIDPWEVAIRASQQTQLLESVLAELRGGVMEIAVSDANRRELVLEQFPVAGAKRVLVNRTGNGFDSLAVPTTGVLALSGNTARLGCTFINSGAFPAILYLANSMRPGVPAVWLAATGGSWDGRFGNLPWSGNVFAVGQGGATTLVGGEL